MELLQEVKLISSCLTGSSSDYRLGLSGLVLFQLWQSLDEVEKKVKIPDSTISRYLAGGRLDRRGLQSLISATRDIVHADKNRASKCTIFIDEIHPCSSPK